MIVCLKDELRLHLEESSMQAGQMSLAADEPIETLYFGGGTPSILHPSEIEALINCVRELYLLSGEAEITLEANPDDMNAENLAAWKRAGINRLSIGIQSFEDAGLRWMNRVHDAAQAIKSIELAMEAGFQNLSVDLIFGVPGLADEEWKQNIDRVINMGIPHVACYALTVEPKTALHSMIRMGKKEDVDQDEQAAQFEILTDRLRAAGYEHYEISNFALPGFRSRHNSSYWQQKRYLGIGPSAHSFDGENRFWNIANNALYMKAIRNKQSFYEKEHLTCEQKINEYIMTALRTMEGMDILYVEERFGSEVKERIKERALQLKKDWYLLKNENLRLTEAGKLFADRISVILFEES